MRHLLLFTGLALAASTAVAQTSISTCNPFVAAPTGSLIAASGDYQVTANLLQNGAVACILIEASNVILKLNGYQIVGSTEVAQGINISPAAGRLNQVVIQGPGLVTGFTMGVAITNCDYCTVTQTTVAANLSNGIFGSDVTFLTLNSNVVDRNSAAGIAIAGSTSGNIQYNEMSGNVRDGLNLSSSSANVVGNNNASGNGLNGIALLSSQGARVSGNRTDGNASDGIDVDEGSGNQIFSNLSSAGNTTYDLQDQNATCGSDSWSNNAFFTVNQSCVH